jgi:predicted amidohydrolase
VVSLKVKVAAIQTAPIPAQPEKTVERALHWLDRAGAEGVKLAVFPEMYYPGYYLFKMAKIQRERYDELMGKFNSLAEPIPGETSRRIGEKAKQHAMHVVFTMLEKDENNNFHNASVLLSSQGELLNIHRKAILTPDVETPEIRPGNQFNVTQTELGNIGQLICADSCGPESSRILAIKGAQIICLSMGGFRVMWKGRDMMGPVIMDLCHASRTRAVDNSLFLIVANLSCQIGGYEYIGKSRVINYLGDILAMGAEGPDKEELVVAEIDVEELAAIPLKMIARRRPEIYGEILQPNLEAKKVSGAILWSAHK